MNKHMPENLKISRLEQELAEEKQLVKAQYVCRILNIPKPRVYQLARSNLLPPGVVVRIGRQVRFDLDALMQWIARGGCVQAQEVSDAKASMRNTQGSGIELQKGGSR